MITLPDDAFAGSYTPLVTPFSDGAVDFPAYERLVEMQISGGSQGIVVTGTSGEPSVLTLEERAELVRLAVRCAGGRISVVAATGCGSHEETVRLSAAAVEAGADALLVVTPFYISPPQRGLVEYFVDIAGRAEVPVLIYHIPGRAAVTLNIATLESIAERAANVVGIKHASTDLALITEVHARISADFRVFAGLEELSLPMLAVGARGMMNAVGNLIPDRIVALWRAVEEQRLGDARKLHMELWELNKSVFFDTNPIPIKYMLKKMGVLERNEHRLPMMSATPEIEERLDGVLSRAGLVVAAQ